MERNDTRPVRAEEGLNIARSFCCIQYLGAFLYKEVRSALKPRAPASDYP